VVISVRVCVWVNVVCVVCERVCDIYVYVVVCNYCVVVCGMFLCCVVCV